MAHWNKGFGTEPCEYADNPNETHVRIADDWFFQLDLESWIDELKVMKGFDDLALAVYDLWKGRTNRQSCQ